jgi:hypothetical protein
MPTPPNLVTGEVDFSGPYFPSAPALSPRGAQSGIRRGSNVWRDPGGKIRVANGLLEMSSQSVGARLFAADIQRASIEGGLVGSRLPYAGLLRYENAVLLFLSEETDAQVYLNESAVSGLTTSSEAGRLRVAVPDGMGGYDVYDAGLSAGPDLSGFGVVAFSLGTKAMEGVVGVALARWRTTTNAIGPVSAIQREEMRVVDGIGNNLLISVNGVALDNGQDGWVVYGTRWNDLSNELRVVRYVYDTLPGTVTLTNGSTTVTGVGTLFTRDVRVDDTWDVIEDGSRTIQIASIESDTELTIGVAWAGSSGSYTLSIRVMAVEWYDSELGDLAQLDIIKPPPAAGVVQYAGRVLVWGCFGGDGNPTGPVIFPMLEDNPEHCFIRGIRTDSGGDLVNVLGADGPLYLMTTLGLEIVTLTGDPNAPYNVRQIASPGFKAATNGILFGDYFYGFNGRPLRTRASKNVDLEFAAPVWSDMEDWDGQRVILAGDPRNQAVLYIYDDGDATTVIPFMTQQEQWGPPLNFSVRFLDAAIVDGDLYVTALDGSDITVNKWEGGTGIGGTRFVASEYYDPRSLRPNRLKILDVVGKVGSLSVYAVEPDADPPDVGDLNAATETFTLSDTSKKEPEIRTNIRGDAFAFRVDFASDDGYVDKIVALGLPRSESR